MSLLEKLVKIRDILKPEVNQMLDAYKRKYDIAKEEYMQTNLSDVVKKEKLNGLAKEIDSELHKYTKNILSHVDLSLHKDIVVNNIIKNSKSLKELTNNSLIDKLVDAKKEKGGSDPIGESKYLPHEYLHQKYANEIKSIYDQIKQESIHDNKEVHESEYYDNQESDHFEDPDLIQEPEDKSDQEIATDRPIENPQKVSAGLRNIYIEPRKIVGAHSSMSSNYSGHDHTHIGNHAVFFVIVIFVLFLLNILYSKCANDAIEVEHNKQPRSPKIGHHKINLYRAEPADLDTNSCSE